MSQAPAVSWTVTDGIARIELCRPERGNALSPAVVESLIDAVVRAGEDDRVHTLALHAAGRHFCTGFDLDELDSLSDGDLLHRFVRIEYLLDLLWQAPVRTLALVQGRAWGAGADLMVACHQRLIAPDTTIRFPGAGFGIVLGTRRLAERVGRDTALRWISSGHTLDQSGALASGLATGSGSIPDDASDRAGAVARLISECMGPAPVVDRTTQRALRQASHAQGEAAAKAAADADLAALVRSAARPGLKARLLAYRQGVKAAAVARKP